MTTTESKIHGVLAAARSMSGLKPRSLATVIPGSISGATSMRPAISAASRCELPPIWETVTSWRVRPSFLSRMPMAMSVSEPKVLMPNVLPLRSPIPTPALVNMVIGMVLQVEVTSRRSAPCLLASTAGASPTCMPWISPESSTCRPRVPPSMLMTSVLIPSFRRSRRPLPSRPGRWSRPAPRCRS